MAERDAFGNETGAATATIHGPAVPEPPDTRGGDSAPAMAWIALACAVAGLIVLPIFASIPAVVLGHTARKAMPRDRPRFPATTAIVLGWIGLLFWGVLITLLIVWIAAVGSIV